MIELKIDGLSVELCRPGGLFCKPGVGLLRRPDDSPYDWFRLYEIVVPGQWLVETGSDYAEFIHARPGRREPPHRHDSPGVEEARGIEEMAILKSQFVTSNIETHFT